MHIKTYTHKCCMLVYVINYDSMYRHMLFIVSDNA